MKMTWIIILTFMISQLLCVIINIPDDYSTIQSGIDVAIDGDTVLVQPGIYYENINLNEKNITIASLELISGDLQYIRSTIIDGQREESCIKIHNVDTGASIRGFTIINGYSSFTDPFGGGGIQIVSSENVHIINCRIAENIANVGGGIFSVWSGISLSGLIVVNNSASLGGGILSSNGGYIEFAQENLCNIYNNNAGTGYDISIRELGQVNVYVDTFTVIQPDKYFAACDESSSFTFSIQNWWMEQIPNNLYVAEDGDDSNSGLSPNDPLKNISWAVRKIIADSLNPRVINVAPGTYSHAVNEQIYPIGCKEYVSIVGDSESNTILCNDFTSLAILGYNLENPFEIANFTIKNDLNVFSGELISFSRCDSVYLNNVKLVDSSNIESIMSIYKTGFYFENVTIANNIAVESSGFVLTQAHGTMIDCSVSNNTSTTNSIWLNVDSALYLFADGDVDIINCKFINNISNSPSSNTIRTANSSHYDSPTIRMINCLVQENQSSSDRIAYILANGSNEFINCTIADNSSGNLTFKAAGDVTMINTIIHNYTNSEIFMGPELNTGLATQLNVDYSNIKNGLDGVINQGDLNIIIWGDGNIELDPLFEENGDFPYLLSAESPCIESGSPDLTGLGIPEWDLLHNERIWDGDGDGTAIIDMGCYEYGAPSYVASEESMIEIPDQYFLTNCPNPFNPVTVISFRLIENSKIELSIFNLKGQKIKLLIDDYLEPGKYTQMWNGLNNDNQKVSSGVYFINLNIDSQKRIVKKCMLLK